jgi:hypothetical protein
VLAALATCDKPLTSCGKPVIACDKPLTTCDNPWQALATNTSDAVGTGLGAVWGCWLSAAGVLAQGCQGVGWAGWARSREGANRSEWFRIVHKNGLKNGDETLRSWLAKTRRNLSGVEP